jgi:hypothetical protein
VIVSHKQLLVVVETVLILMKNISCGHIQKIDNKALLETSLVSQLTSSEPVMCSKCNTAYSNDSDYQLHYNEKHKSEEKGTETAYSVKDKKSCS